MTGPPDISRIERANDCLAREVGIAWKVKVIGMLQQNWAVIVSLDARATVLFVDDRSGVFDCLEFVDEDAAIRSLERNGFKDHSPSSQHVMPSPEWPLVEGRHPNGPIYSSGTFWK